MFLDKTVKNITRLSQVINILVKYSFEDIITSTALKKFIPPKMQVIWQRSDQSIFEFSRWERIRMVIEDLGPTFVKLAQLLSNRPDLLPEGLIYEFTKLQSHVPPFETKIAKEIIERRTEKKISELFSYFDNKPIGSASIGQVHRARLINGDDVVVKIQRPGAENKVKTDLRLLREFVKLTENYFVNIGILNPIEVVDTFEKTMYKELNYNTEARSIQQFRTIYQDQKNLYIPKPYREYTSEKILVIEFISGCKISDINQLEKWGLNPKIIAENGMAIYLTQIFEYGFFHADPHPGNVLVQPNGTIALVDYGMIGKLTKREKYNFSNVLMGLASQDPKKLAISIQRLAINSEIEDLGAFEKDLEELIDDFVILDVDRMGMSELARRLQKIIYDYQLQIPGSIFLILRALAILEGIGSKLHPDFQTLKFIRPYGAKLIREQYSVENMKSEFSYTFSHLISFLSSSPIDLKFILKKIRNGKLHVNIEVIGYEKLIKKIDILTNRFVLTFLIISLVIASAIMINSNPAQIPFFFGMPLTSIVGFALAIFLSIILFFYVLRHRNGKK